MQVGIIVPIEDDLYLPLFVLYIVNTNNWVNLMPTLYSTLGTRSATVLCPSHMECQQLVVSSYIV